MRSPGVSARLSNRLYFLIPPSLSTSWENISTAIIPVDPSEILSGVLLLIFAEAQFHRSKSSPIQMRHVFGNDGGAAQRASWSLRLR